MPVTITAGKLKQEDYKFQAGLDYTVKPCLKKRKKNKADQREIKHQNRKFLKWTVSQTQAKKTWAAVFSSAFSTPSLRYL